MFKKIESCRICDNRQLECVLDLGEQMLTGVFPRSKSELVTVGPLRLVKCAGGEDVCGLLQLGVEYNDGEMYGENYGYRSGLNASMVEHLRRKVRRILDQLVLNDGDLVVDIGSNDGTTLSMYPAGGLVLVGIDPVCQKFQQDYPSHVRSIPDFFSASLLREKFPGQQAKVVTSFSMFYDLEKPTSFMQEVHEMLADDGIWVFEQSYMPTMLAMNAYDTVCHEHREYYALRQIKWMTDRVGFTIVDVEFNDVNGGSFSVTAMKSRPGVIESDLVTSTLAEERRQALDSLGPYLEFAARVAQLRYDLLSFLDEAAKDGKEVVALGASTKGNVVLQYCGITEQNISFVGEVNSEKFGRYTPGTWIPIVSQDEVLATHPDYLLVMPWHFRQFFVRHPKLAGRKLLFPLPAVDVVEAGA